MHSSSKSFTELVLQKFKFLEKKGFTFEISPLIKDETSIKYKSQDISFSFTHSFLANECWCYIDVIEIEPMIMPIPFLKFTCMLEISYSHIREVDANLTAIASKIQNELRGLFNGDLSLLHAYRTKSEKLNNEQLEYQKKIALTIEKIGDVLVMELPNTKAALGDDFSETHPENNFKNPVVWLVSTKFADMFCEDYAQAVETASMFK